MSTPTMAVKLSINAIINSKMADKTVLSGSKNCTYINPFNWDLYEIIQYKDRKCFTNDGKRIKWSDTFEMLKLFIK